MPPKATNKSIVDTTPAKEAQDKPVKKSVKSQSKSPAKAKEEKKVVQKEESKTPKGNHNQVLILSLGKKTDSTLNTQPKPIKKVPKKPQQQ